MLQRKYYLALFLVLQIICLNLLTFVPEYVEIVYSNGCYPLLSKSERFVFGAIPISVGDLLYATLILYLVFSLLKVFRKRKTAWKVRLLRLINLFSVVFFLFHFLWAFNYYRLPLFEKMNLSKEYSDADLIHFTEKLIDKTNTIHFGITKNKQKTIQPTWTQQDLFVKTQNGYQKLGTEYPYFTYSYPSQKSSLFSTPLTYMGFSGYLNPFTNEMQVNKLLPKTAAPMVVCHEMAHQMGYASESECNFIGFLASTKNEDPIIQYSGYANALRYCLALIAQKDAAKFEQLKKTLHPGIIADFRNNEQFWKSYDTIIEKGFHAFYDHYLKMNQQEEGMKSYSKFVDLMINYYRDKQF